MSPISVFGVQHLNPSSFSILLYTGDIMATAIEHMNLLVQKPLGCGEQNMIHFAPNVFVLKYLQKTRQLSPEVENEATDYLLQGKETAAQPHSGFHDILHPETKFLNPLK